MDKNNKEAFTDLTKEEVAEIYKGSKPFRDYIPITLEKIDLYKRLYCNPPHIQNQLNKLIDLSDSVLWAFCIDKEITNEEATLFVNYFKEEQQQTLSQTT